jgi:hypothetical protein
MQGTAAHPGHPLSLGWQMSQPKITIFEMAEAVGNNAFSARGYIERWDRDHPNDPLPPDHSWVKDARVFETAHVTLSLMALDEEASRKFIGSIIESKGADAKMLMAMLTTPHRKITTGIEVDA